MRHRSSKRTPKLGTSAAVLCILLVFIAPLALLCAAASFDHGIQDPEEPGPVLAIDLGTTHSQVAVVQNGTAKVLVNSQRRGVLDDPGRFPLGIANRNGSTAGQVDVRELSETLSELRAMAEERLGTAVRYAVVTVPGDFDETQRQALKDAGRLAGVDVLRPLKKFVAACLAYKIDQQVDDRYVIVYHLDTETFNVSLLLAENGVMELLASSGDMDIYGKDFDRDGVEYVLKSLNGKDNTGTVKDQRAVSGSGSEMEKAMEGHSTRTLDHLNLRDTSDREVVSERSNFESLSKDLFEATWAQIEQVLHDGQVGKHDINDIILTGGSPRLPYMQTQLLELFDGKQIGRGIKPDEVVALGGAIYGDLLIPRDIDYGFCSAIVSPMVGVEFADGFSAEVIRSHNLLPTFTSHNFSVFPDGQGAMSMKIFVSESFRAAESTSLGNITLTGLVPSLGQVSHVEVTSYFSRDGMLKVRAIDRLTAVGETITVQDPGYQDLVWDSEAIANSSYGAGGDLKQEYEREKREREARCYCNKEYKIDPSSIISDPAAEDFVLDD